MKTQFSFNHQTYEIKLEKHGDVYNAFVMGQSFVVAILEERPGTLMLDINGTIFHFSWAEKDRKKWIAARGFTYELESALKHSGQRESGSRNCQRVHAPMPAQVRAVEVEIGDQVIRGQSIILLEAMKMEIRLTAEIQGQIQEIHVLPGQTVNRDDLLMTIEAIA